jgi:hypothetical protein
VLRAKNNYSKENVFAFNSKNDQNGNAGGEAYGGIFGTFRGDQLTHNGGLFLYIPELDYVGAGWGATSGTRKALYEAFVEIEGADGFRLQGSILTWDDFQRLGIGFAQPYFSSEGYWDIKHRPVRAEVNSWIPQGSSEWTNTSNGFKPMRYAEVLLNAAEACIRSNDAGSALTYINIVRTRAHLAPLASVTLTDIKKEKRLELYKEGSRYIDLVRWEVLGDADGITASNMLGEQGRYLPTFDGTVNSSAFILTAYGWKKNRHELLPIPEAELNANSLIEQNPGY